VRAHVSRGKKGKWRVYAVTDHEIDAQVLLDLAQDLREIPGVKRAIARLHDGLVYLRVNEGVKGLYRVIRERANKFLGRRYYSSRTRPRNTFSNRPSTVRPDPGRVTMRRLQQELIPTR